MLKTWLLDVTNGVNEMPCFCPYEEETGMIMTGLMLVQPRCPGELVGVFHEGGQEAADTWCQENRDWHERYA
jgi:hypothetical protein